MKEENKDRLMVLLLLLLTWGGAFLMGLNSHPPPITVVEKVQVPVVHTVYNNCTSINQTSVPVAVVTPRTSKYGYGVTKYGGIPGNITSPPNGAVRTTYWNKIPVAVTSNGTKYYFVGSWGWFTQKEFDAMPSYNRDYDVSPYASDKET